MRKKGSIVSLLGIAVWATVITTTTAYGQTRSRIVNQCTNQSDCLPKTAMVLIVLVVDAEDGIAGVPVEIIRSDAPSPPSSTIPTRRTDKNGVAVGGLPAADLYRLKIDMPGHCVRGQRL